MRAKKAAGIGLGIVAGLIAIALILVLGVSNTNPGRMFVRRQLVGFLQQKVHGIVRVGAIEGNLLTGMTVHDLSITDSAGVPFLAADEIRARYRIGDFAGKKLWFRDVVLVRPLLMFDKPPDGEWNTKRLFPEDKSDTLPDDPNAPGGWGDWLALFNARVTDGKVVVRAPWNSKDTMDVAQRDSAAMDDLAEGTRSVVIKVPGGYQKVTEIRAINGIFPRIVLEDDYRDKHDLGRLIEARRVGLVAAVFKPPVLQANAVTGVIEFDSDSAWFRNLRAQLPGSNLTATGTYYSTTDEMHVVAKGNASFGDFRWVFPTFPSTGGGTLDFEMTWDEERGDTYLVKNANLKTGGATARGDFGIRMKDDSVFFQDADFVAAGVDTRLVEQIAEIDVPRRGTVGGSVKADGPLHAVRVQADLTFDDVQAGRNRVVAAGVAGMANGAVRASNLRVRVLPLQLALVKSMAELDLPVGGVLQGAATVTGQGKSWTVTGADVTHADAGATSRVTGRAELRMTGRTWVNVDLQAQPLSLATVGRFAPALGLRGAASGPIRLRGALGDLALDARLGTSDGGALSARGRLDLEGEKAYDVAMAATLFNVNAVVARAPRTSLTATARARGRGFDPATMSATFAADVAGSRLDTINIDSARVRVAIDQGLLRVNTLRLSGPGSVAEVRGTFGLAQGRTGELAFNVSLDSLAPIARWLPQDTGVVAPRPAVAARAIERARADSVRLARATEIERLVTGGAAPKLQVDTQPSIRRETVSGSLHAAGTVRGGLQGFDLRARATTERLVAAGSTVRRARAEIAWLGARTPQASLIAAAQLDSAMVKGFALDSVDARVTYAGGGRGTAQMLVVQDDEREYGARFSFEFHQTHKEIHFADARIRFDTTRWASTQAGAVQWGGGGVRLRTIEFRNQYGGRIHVNGFLPTEPTATAAGLDFAITEFEIGDVLALAQSDIDATGRLTLTGRFDGTTRDPRLRAVMLAHTVRMDGKPVPDLRGTLSYANARLAANAQAARLGGTSLARLEASIPINLAAGATGPRFRRDLPMSVDFDADSLPLDALPSFTDAVSHVRGRVVGALRVRGSFNQPRTVGQLALDLGSFRVVPTGTQFRQLHGFLRIADDSVVIDSIVGYAGGPVRVVGGIGIANPLRPSFDLRVVAQNARLMDNEQGTARADAELSIYGVFERVYVSGGVRVREGVIYLPESDGKEVISAGDPALFNVLDTSLVSNKELLPGQSPFLKNLRMDINLGIERDTWVRSSEANVEIFTDGDLTLRIDRGRDAIVLEGVVSSERGSYTYLGKTFLVRRGAATFIGSPELNPTIQATAEYEVRIPGQEALFIRLLIGGTMNNLRLALESDAQPPIPQSDLLSYLAFGRSSSSLLQFGGSGVAGSGQNNIVGATASLASQQLTAVALDAAVSELEGDAARELGADVFSVRTADVPSEIWNSNLNSFVLGTEVEFGKYLDRESFLALQLRLRSVPGIRYELRPRRGLRYELSFETRYLLQEPSLEPRVPVTTGVFGAFVVKEWRF